MDISTIKEKLEVLVDSKVDKTLKETGAIKHVGIDPEKNNLVLIIVLAEVGGEAEKSLKREIAKIAKLELGFAGVKIQFEEKRKLEGITNRSNVKFIVVASGKGGVGKSTVACNLAYALVRAGKKVGMIDADIYGSSVPQILEIPHSHPKATSDSKIIPFHAFGIEFISTEFFAEEGKPVIWRGAMLNSMMQNFFYEVKWSKDLEFMIIDSPPGTGDIMMDLRSHAPNAEVLMVTTPHLAASHVATKAGIAHRQLKHDIIGVVENMSYYINPVNNEKEFIFGKGGGEKVSQTLASEFLAQIPINQPIHHLSLYESDEEVGQIYDDLAALVAIR